MAKNWIKYLSATLMLICVLVTTRTDAQVVKAQLEEVKTNDQRRSQSFGISKTYRFTAAAKADTVSVKVINPRGEMQVLPVREAKIAALSSLDFAFNTKHWIPGMYHVIVNGKHGRYSKRFKILDPREQ